MIFQTNFQKSEQIRLKMLKNRFQKISWRRWTGRRYWRRLQFWWVYKWR